MFIRLTTKSFFDSAKYTMDIWDLHLNIWSRNVLPRSAPVLIVIVIIFIIGPADICPVRVERVLVNRLATCSCWYWRCNPSARLRVGKCGWHKQWLTLTGTAAAQHARTRGTLDVARYQRLSPTTSRPTWRILINLQVLLIYFYKRLLTPSASYKAAKVKLELS